MRHFIVAAGSALLRATPAVLALTDRVTRRSSAAALVAAARRTHRHTPANGRATFRAVRLASIALATDAHQASALAAMELPKALEYRPQHAPARWAGQRAS